MTAASPANGPILKSPSIVAVAASLGIATLTVYLLVVGEAILMPLVLAIFISYLIIALSHGIQRIRPGGRGVPGWLALTLAILFLVLVIAGMVQLIAGNIRAVVLAAPQYQDRLQELFIQIQGIAARALNSDEPITFTTLVDNLDLPAIVGRFAGAFQAIAGNTFQIFAYVFFLLLENRTLRRKIKALFPEPEREATVHATLQVIGGKIETYVLIKTGVSLLTASLSYLVMRVIGVDFAAFWALLIFALNFIPYIGTPIAIFFPTVLSLLQFADPVTTVILLGFLVGIQLLVENVIEPRIAGKSLNLSPVVMMLSLSTWGAIWGITGMILSVPMMVIVMIVLAQFLRTRPIAIAMSESGDVK